MLVSAIFAGGGSDAQPSAMPDRAVDSLSDCAQYHGVDGAVILAISRRLSSTASLKSPA